MMSSPEDERCTDKSREDRYLYLYVASYESSSHSEQEKRVMCVLLGKCVCVCVFLLLPDPSLLPLMGGEGRMEGGEERRRGIKRK